jgi:apolipoprotein N-acyltransferase
MRTFALSIASGAALGFLFYFPRLWWTVFVALVPFFIFFERNRHSPRTLFLGTALMAVTMSAILVSTLWPTEDFVTYVREHILYREAEWVRSSAAIGAGFLVVLAALTALVSLPFTLILGGGVAFLGNRRAASEWFLIPALWTLAEFSRAVVSGGFTYGHLGYRVVDFLSFAITSRLWGVYGLSFMVVLVNQLIATILARRFSIPSFVVAAVVFVVMVSGYAWTKKEAAAGWQGQPLRVAIVHGGIAGTGAGFDAAAVLPRQYDALVRALDPGVDVVVLPSTVGEPLVGSTGDNGNWDAAELYFAQLLADIGARTIISGHRIGESEKRYNAMIAWESGGVRGVYRKRVLFPFGEYFPVFENMFPSLFPPNMRYTAAPDGERVLRTKSGTIGVLICQEIDMPSLAFQSVTMGAELFVSGGSEWQFGRYVHAEQLAIARLRALESSRFFLRAMKGGTYAIIDPLGRVAVAPALAQQADVLEGEAYLSTAMTPYVSFGDSAVIAVLAFGAALLLAFGRRVQ